MLAADLVKAMRGGKLGETAPHPGESEKERVDRELIELLNEIRVALPGVQVLFAFLFAAPFQQGWADISDVQSRVFLASFFSAGLATAFLIAPTTYHRLTFRMGHKERLLRVGNIFTLLGTFFLALAMSLALFVVVSLVIDDLWAAIAAALTMLVLMVLWYVLPLALRNSRVLTDEPGLNGSAGEPTESSQHVG
ncbi:MAG: hypothetical protein QOJ13_3212 [Gaiellales bacterium]|jgi:amino acid transporter|nr:hypothetical protein [Gaiellales bacterium]MDX6594016.1 hypothetical protein [Gaiellales bacterium]